MIWRNALLDPPPMYKPVIVYACGVVQTDTYTRVTNSDGSFWFRDDPDVIYEVIKPDHYWMPLPSNPELGEKK